MRLYGRWAPLALSFATLGVAGCGTSAPTPKPTVNVAITAPTSGAVVGVQHVVVAGTVTPANAQVLVAGHPAQVSGGRFTRSLFLASPRQVVTVTAQAQGYVAAQAATTVNYSPNLAAQLVASSSALNAPAAANAPGAPGSSSTPATNNALNTALALPKSASSSAGPNSSTPAHTTPTHTAPPQTTPTQTTPTHAAPTPPTPAPSPAPSPTPPSSGGSTPPPSPPVMTVDRIRQIWDAGCLKHVKGQNVVPYCTCLYKNLSARGTFKTPATVNAFLKKLHAYAKKGDLYALPRAIRLALTVCSTKLPALTTLGGQPTLTKLPGLSHKRVPFPVIVKLRPKSH
jgi:Glucodextranase, domain B